MEAYGFDLPFELLQQADWHPAVFVATSQLERAQEIAASLQLRQGVPLLDDGRQQLLLEMAEAAKLEVHEIPTYTQDSLELFSRVLPKEEQYGCLGIDEIGGYDVWDIYDFVQCGTVYELILLMGCRLNGKDYASAVWKALTERQAPFESLLSNGDDLYLACLRNKCSAEAVLRSVVIKEHVLEAAVPSPLSLSDWQREILDNCKTLVSKTACVGNALLALKFAYFKVNDPAVFYAVCKAHMAEDIGVSGEEGPMYGDSVLWRAQERLGLPHTSPRGISLREAAACLRRYGEDHGQPDFGIDLLLCSEINEFLYAE